MATHIYTKLRLECYEHIKGFLENRPEEQTEISIDRLYAIMSLQYGYSKRFVVEAVRVLAMTNPWTVREREGVDILQFREVAK